MNANEASARLCDMLATNSVSLGDLRLAITALVELARAEGKQEAVLEAQAMLATFQVVDKAMAK